MPDKSDNSHPHDTIHHWIEHNESDFARVVKHSGLILENLDKPNQATTFLVATDEIISKIEDGYGNPEENRARVIIKSLFLDGAYIKPEDFAAAKTVGNLAGFKMEVAKTEAHSVEFSNGLVIKPNPKFNPYEKSRAHKAVWIIVKGMPPYEGTPDYVPERRTVNSKKRGVRGGAHFYQPGKRESFIMQAFDANKKQMISNKDSTSDPTRREVDHTPIFRTLFKYLIDNCPDAKNMIPIISFNHPMSSLCILVMKLNKVKDTDQVLLPETALAPLFTEFMPEQVFNINAKDIISSEDYLSWAKDNMPRIDDSVRQAIIQRKREILNSDDQFKAMRETYIDIFVKNQIKGKSVNLSNQVIEALHSGDDPVETFKLKVTIDFCFLSQSNPALDRLDEFESFAEIERMIESCPLVLFKTEEEPGINTILQTFIQSTWCFHLNGYRLNADINAEES